MTWSMRHLRDDTRGATVMEFGILATTFVMLLMGLFDVGQTAYTKAVLNGAVQQAARVSGLETGDTAAADAFVTKAVQSIAPGATVTASRVSYFDYADLGRAESFNDENSNGTCDDEEEYTDENDNGHWDADIGSAGNGHASDVVIYTVEVKYTSSFASAVLPYSMGQRTLTARTVKKNQPYADQPGYGSEAGTCA